MTGLGRYLLDSWGVGERVGWRFEVFVFKKVFNEEVGNTADEVDVLCDDSGHFF